MKSLKIKKRFKVLITLGIVVIGGLAARAFFDTQKKTDVDFVAVTKGTVIREVTVTGQVKSALYTNLAFEQSGTIRRADGSVGDEVTEGAVLVELENAALHADLAGARADVTSAYAQRDNANASLASAYAGLDHYKAALEKEEIKLDELKLGTRPEEIKISQTKLDNAQKALNDAQKTLTQIIQEADVDLANFYADVDDILQDAYATASDAINNKTEPLFTDDLTNQPKLTFTTTDFQGKIDIEIERAAVQDVLESMQKRAAALSSEYDQLDRALVDTDADLVAVRVFLFAVDDLLNDAVNVSASNLDMYKTDIHTGITDVNTSLVEVNNEEQMIVSQKVDNEKAITAQESKVHDAENAYVLAKDELALKKAGSTRDAITAQEAAIKQARANVKTQEAGVAKAVADVNRARADIEQARATVLQHEARLSKTVLRTPIDGIISLNEARVGEIVAVGSVIVSIVNPDQFKITAPIPEVDVAYVQVDDLVSITLDAYGSDVVFEGKVTAIDPSETVIDGVATYTATIYLNEYDDRVKPGMTANIDIATDRQEGVLFIPQSALVTKEREKLVRILRFSNKEKREVAVDVVVQTGLRGSDGNVEIIQGLQEGDKVLVSF